ncbi:MAG: nodulation protein NfeD [Tepidisphaerales bacterium]
MTVRLLAIIAGIVALAAQVTAQTTRPGVPPGAKAAVVELHVYDSIDDYDRSSFIGRFTRAVDSGAKVVIVDLDTYGGLVTSALEISQFLKQQRGVHTIAYVNTKAYSAGAMIALACDEVVMNPTAAIGDCAPIVPAADGTIRTMGQDERAKATSPIIADFRDSAERNGHDPTLVLAMVSVREVVNWIENPATGQRRFVDDKEAARLLSGGQWRTVSGPGIPEPLDGPDTLLTLHTDLAIKTGLAKNVYANIAAIEADRGFRIDRTYAQGAWEPVLKFFSTGTVRAALIAIFLTCLYISLHAPGHGMAEVIATLSLALAVGVPLLTGYAQWWEIAMILVGLVLLALEVFVIPGFGVAAVLGLVLTLGGLLLTFVAPEPGRSPLALPTLPGTWHSVQTGLAAIVGAMLASIVLCAILRRYLPSMPMFRKLVLTTAVGETETAMAGSISRIDPSEQLPAIGAHGVAVTELKPGGSVQFHDSAGAVHTVSVVSESGYVARGSGVVVVKIEGPTILVHATESKA